MNYYFEIKLNSNKQFPVNVLMNLFYTKLHFALFNMNSHDIGVSFPDVQITLGHRIRLHGNEQSLKQLHEMNWSQELNERCTVGSVKIVPKENISYRTVSRKQSNKTNSKMNRLIKRGTINQEQAKLYKIEMLKNSSLTEPYVELRSTTNHNLYRKYILHGDIQTSPVIGEFDHYGLSSTATVPWF